MVCPWSILVLSLVFPWSIHSLSFIYPSSIYGLFLVYSWFTLLYLWSVHGLSSVYTWSVHVVSGVLDGRQVRMKWQSVRLSTGIWYGDVDEDLSTEYCSDRAQFQSVET